MKEIPLTKGCFAIVDDEDYDWLSKYKWHSSHEYANTTIIKDGKRKTISMHRMIMNCPEGKVIDHINGNRHDNRKENLRIADMNQNAWNVKKTNKNKITSKYKGISYENECYIVRISYNGKKERIGTFYNEIAAANAWNYYAKMHHGEFAHLNDVPYMEKEEWENYKSKTSSIYKGVSWNENSRKWIVRVNNKHMGSFEDEIVAANYYNHLMGDEINKCGYISLDDCENNKYIRKVTSKYMGVSWSKHRNKWVSRIHDCNKYLHVGYFDSEIEAAIAWNKKAIELNIANLQEN